MGRNLFAANESTTPNTEIRANINQFGSSLDANRNTITRTCMLDFAPRQWFVVSISVRRRLARFELAHLFELLILSLVVGYAMKTSVTASTILSNDKYSEKRRIDWLECGVVQFSVV